MSFKVCFEFILIVSIIFFCIVMVIIIREDDMLSDCSDSILFFEEVDLKGILYDLLEKMREV